MIKNIFRKGILIGVLMLIVGTNFVSGINIDLKNSIYPTKTNVGNTLYVGGSGPGNYTSIQAAVDDAELATLWESAYVISGDRWDLYFGPFERFMARLQGGIKNAVDRVEELLSE